MWRGTPARSRRGCVCAFCPTTLELEVEDHGVGFAGAARQAWHWFSRDARAVGVDGRADCFFPPRRVEREYISKFQGRKWSLMAKKITVLLVDDHSLVRRGFRRMLEDESDMEVVGEAGNGEESIKMAKELHPRWW